MVKPVSVMGTLVLTDAIVQVFLGFQVAGGVEGLRDAHMFIGILGLLLVIAFRTKTATIYSKVIMTTLTLIVLGQVYLGFQLLVGTEELMTSHQIAGLLIVILSLVMGGVTFWSARREAGSRTSRRQ